MIVKECSQKYYNRLLSKNKVDNDTLYVIKPKYKELEAENKKLQEQISEANKLILWCARISWTGDQREDIFDKYLAKWGVK